MLPQVSFLIRSPRNIPFLVGGTGLYISSVVRGYDFQEETIDPAYRNELEKKSLEELQDMLSDEAKTFLGENNSDRNNKRRLIRLLEKTRNGEKLTAQNSPRYKALQLGVTWEKSILHRRIDERLKQRLDQGMIDDFNNAHNTGSLLLWDGARLNRARVWRPARQAGKTKGVRVAQWP